MLRIELPCRQELTHFVIDEDPREALLKYADMAEDDPQWVGSAYKKTQPKAVFQQEEEEEEEE